MGVSHLLLLGPFYTIQTIQWANILHPSVDWSTQKVVNFRFSKSFDYCKNQPNLSIFFIEEYRIRRRTFISSNYWISSFFKHYIFWNCSQLLACSNQSKFQINLDKDNNLSVGIYLFPVFCLADSLKLHNCNHANLDLLRGGKDLSAGGNCLIVTNCSRFLKMALNLDEGRVLNQWTKRRVLLVCHKNKWHDLSQKLVTSFCLFLFIEGGQENIFIGPKNIFNQ